MPVFQTPESIAVTLELAIGNASIIATQRTDTVVEVRPSNAADKSDVEAAQQVRVDYANGELRIIAPKRTFDFSHKSRSVDVTIELPSGSRVSAETQLGGFRGEGRLGECRFKTAAGNIRLERTGPLRLSTSAGHVTAGGIAGRAEITSGSGKIEIGQIEGTGVVKNSNGNITIGAVTGEVRLRSANGDIDVERAGAGVDAKTANGTIRLGEVVRGSIELETAMGNLEVGVAGGTAAWLEVNTGFGHVRNLMDDAAGADGAEETVEVRGRTSFGDVIIRRS